VELCRTEIGLLEFLSVKARATIIAEALLNARCWFCSSSSLLRTSDLMVAFTLQEAHSGKLLRAVSESPEFRHAQSLRMQGSFECEHL